MTKHEPIPEGIRPSNDDMQAALAQEKIEAVAAGLSAIRARRDHTSGLRDQLELELQHLMTQSQGLNDRHTAIVTEGERRKEELVQEGKLRTKSISQEVNDAERRIRETAARRYGELDKEMEARREQLETEITSRLEHLTSEKSDCLGAIQVTRAALESLDKD